MTQNDKSLIKAFIAAKRQLAGYKVNAFLITYPVVSIQIGNEVYSLASIKQAITLPKGSQNETF